MREMVAGTMGAQISANFVPPIPAFSQPNINRNQLKKPDLERKSKGKIKKKIRKEKEKTLPWMGSAAAVRLGLLVAVRWLGRQIRTRDGERMVVGFWPEMENAQWSGGLMSGRRWRAPEWLTVASS
jgi:hypothetical protein